MTPDERLALPKERIKDGVQPRTIERTTKCKLKAHNPNGELYSVTMKAVDLGRLKMPSLMYSIRNSCAYFCMEACMDPESEDFGKCSAAPHSQDGNVAYADTAGVFSHYCRVPHQRGP